MEDIKYSLKELSRQEIENFEPPKSIFKGFPLYLGQLSLVSGEPGAFKTLLWQLLVYAILSKKFLFGKFNNMISGPVMWFDSETPRGILQHRLTTELLINFIGDTLHYFHFPNLRLDRQECVEELIKMVEEVKPILIVFDSLTRFHNQDEIKSTKGGMSAVMDVFRIVSNLGPHVSVLHHFSKGTRKTSRGSGDIVAAVDVEFNTLRASKAQKKVELGVGKTRIENLEPICLRFVGLEGLESDSQVSVQFEGTRIEEILWKVWDTLKECGPLAKDSSNKKVSTICSKLSEKKIAFTDTTLNTALSDGIKIGCIARAKVKIERDSGKPYSTEGYCVASKEPPWVSK